VQPGGIPAIGQLLRFRKIVDADEGVIQYPVADPTPLQLSHSSTNLAKEDISTLPARGHFYFALTRDLYDSIF
jgi:hypothetical protein